LSFRRLLQRTRVGVRGNKLQYSIEIPLDQTLWANAESSPLRIQNPRKQTITQKDYRL
jgi:hypothetical protein